MSRSAKRRPVFFNLRQIDLPVTAVVSFGHRISGVILAFSIPALIYLLQLSLRSREGYAWVTALFSNRFAKAGAVILLWVFLHHLLAGVRHLLFDIDVGVGRRAARISAWTVLLSEFALVVLASGILV